MAAVAGIHSATATLGAATEDVVTLSGVQNFVELVHHGDVSDVIYFRTDGVAAVAAADENGVILASERLMIGIPDSGVISLISAGAATYTVATLT